MLAVLLAFQLAADTNYQSAALREFVELAARQNRVAPASLSSYRAGVETEIALMVRTPDGTEGVISLEQVESVARWRRPGTLEQHVVGYRSQTTSPFSALSFLRDAWLVPHLYGNRIMLMSGVDTTRRRRNGPTLTAIHPLAEDRDRMYRYSGGDTVVTMRVGGRAIPIVRVDVAPRHDAPRGSLAFEGELDIDATRHHLVRMRGRMLAIDAPLSLAERVMSGAGLVGVAYIELENGELEGTYWLPTYQRLEAQGGWTTTTDARSAVRIVSRFHDYRLNDTTVVAASDTLAPRPFRLTYAPDDSVSAFDDWRRELGTSATAVHSDDFDDVAPDVWRPTGPPRTTFRVRHFRDAFRFNRVEGAFTGWGVETRFRDRAPGLSLSAHGGWAWSEGVARGGGRADWSRGPLELWAGAGRHLQITNDFRSPFDSGAALAGLFGYDDYDYVDRRFVALGAARRVTRSRRSLVRVELGLARDAMVERHLDGDWGWSDSSFRENRGVRPGSYLRTRAALELNADVNAEFMRPGVGALLSVERGDGDLDYTRLESRLTARRNLGAVSVAGRLDAGALLGTSPPPQQLFELGKDQTLHGYQYKEFVGNRAVVTRALVMRALPVLRAPIVVGRWRLPSLSPALAASFQGAWSELRGDGAEAAARELARVPPGASDDDGVFPVPAETDGFRTSVTLGLRFFGGSVGLGLARPLDRRRAWRFRVDFGQFL